MLVLLERWTREQQENRAGSFGTMLGPIAKVASGKCLGDEGFEFCSWSAEEIWLSLWLFLWNSQGFTSNLVTRVIFMTQISILLNQSINESINQSFKQ